MTAAAGLLEFEPSRRKLAFEQAAAVRGLQPTIVEKDFWVCWTLRALFSSPALAQHLVFKGGTCLSKVYGAIERFSEDVDLSLSPAFAGIDAERLDGLTSNKARAKEFSELQEKCGEAVRAQVQPMVEARAHTELGAPPGDAWFEYEWDDAARSPVLLFNYPSTQPPLGYLIPSVKLEFGSLTDQQPVGTHPLRPLAADSLPNLFENWECDVVALDLGRCFWEKATILHAEYHRRPGSTTPPRYARHYADVARIVARPDIATILGDRALCERTAEWKDRWFHGGWQHYSTARHGTFKLAPHADRRSALGLDYRAMRSMFLTEPPRFDHVIETLQHAEREINGA